MAFLFSPADVVECMTVARSLVDTSHQNGTIISLIEGIDNLLYELERTMSEMVQVTQRIERLGLVSDMSIPETVLEYLKKSHGKCTQGQDAPFNGK